MPSEDTVTIKLKADTSDYTSKMEKAKKSTEGIKDTTAKAKESTKGFSKEASKSANTLSNGMGKRFSDAFKGVSDSLKNTIPSFGKLSKASEGFGQKISKMSQTSAGKFGILGLAIGAVIAVVGLAVKAFQKLWGAMNDAAKAWNPQEYEKAEGRLQNSTKSFKTALGAFTSPIVNGLKNLLADILDLLTGALKKVYSIFVAVYDFFKTLLQPLIDGIMSAFNALQNALMPGSVQTINKALEETKKSTEGIGEAAEYATGALAGFDKLNTGDMAGDAKTYEEMTESASDLSEKAIELAHSIMEPFNAIKEFFESLDIGQIFDGIGETFDNIGRSIGNVLGPAWNGFTNTVSSSWNVFVAGAGQAWNSISTGAVQLGEGVYNTMVGAWNGVTNVAGNAWATISKIAGNTWDSITGMMSNLWDDMVSGLSGTIDGFMDAMSSGMTSAWTTITDTFQSLWQGAISWLNDTFNAVFSVIQDTINGIIDSVKWVTDSIGSIGSGIGDFFGGVGDAIGGAIGFAANGDVIKPSDGLQMRVVGDNKRETEVISPLSTIRQAVSEVMVAQGGLMNSRPIDVTLEIDGKKLARITYDDFQSEGSRRGAIA